MNPYAVTVVLLLGVVGLSSAQEQEGSYQKNVLMDLCQYIGVSYVRNPENPECGYIACWDRHPYHMPCAPGLKVHPLFFWGDSYPCTEKDGKDSCNYIKQFYSGKAPQAGSSARAKDNYHSKTSTGTTGYTRSSKTTPDTSTYSPTTGK